MSKIKKNRDNKFKKKNIWGKNNKKIRKKKRVIKNKQDGISDSVKGLQC